MTAGAADALTFSAAAIVVPHPLAATAARDVMIEGGNVVEAAVTAAAVAAVAVPHRNGLGGDALWLIREAGPRGRVRVIDARGLIAGLATPAHLRELGHETVPVRGPNAALSVPGAVAGWAEALALSTALGGRLPLSRLLAPAIAAARDGVAASVRDATALAEVAPSLTALPGFEATFLEDGKPPAAGAIRRQPALAATLEHLARAGLADLYRGDVGRELAVDLEASGCLLARDDLRRGEARWRKPATLDLGRETLDVAPHGPAVWAAVVLGLHAGLGPSAPDGFERWHGLIEAAKHAADVIGGASSASGDLSALLDRDHLKRAAERIDRALARQDAPPSPPFPEDGVFIGAVDRDGTAVALVQSIGSAWGSGVVSRRTGILLGNRASMLTLDGAGSFALAPGRRAPLRSTPALLSGRSGRVTSFGATGPYGGAVVAQLAGQLIAGATSTEALVAPRFAWGAAPDGSSAVLIEAERDPHPARQLRAAGHMLHADAAVDLRTAALAVRLPANRVEAVADQGIDAVSGL